jgi:hypothetical protein
MGLPARKIVRREHKTLYAFAARQRFHDLRDIGRSDAPVKEMVWLDQNADAARTLVEATRFTDARAEFRQTPRRHLFLQRRPDFLGPAHRARTFRVVIRAPVRANKKVALALRHVVKSTAASRRSTRFGEKLLGILRDGGGRGLRLVLRDARARGEQEAADQENERGDNEFFHKGVVKPPSVARR